MLDRSKRYIKFEFFYLASVIDENRLSNLLNNVVIKRLIGCFPSCIRLHVGVHLRMLQLIT